MKILYALCGEGMGHATRSKAVIEHLREKGHEVRIVTGGRAYTYLSRFYQVIEITGLYLKYKNNRIDLLNSVLMNAKNVFKYQKTMRTIQSVIQKFKPDVIINDYELVANYLARLNGIPVITVDNNRVSYLTKIQVPKRFLWSRMQTGIVNLAKGSYGYHIILSFFEAPLKVKNAKIVFSPIRKEIKRLKTSNKGPVLVYQTSASNNKLIDDLKATKAQYTIYGFNEKKRIKNLTFKLFNEKVFFKDLARAKAVIMNGGFSLMSECLYLKKPILSIPVKGQFEQELNAIYLERLGYGMMAEESSGSVLRSFLKKTPGYTKHLLSAKFDPNECLVVLDEKLKEVKALKS